MMMINDDDASSDLSITLEEQYLMTLPKAQMTADCAAVL